MLYRSYRKEWTGPYNIFGGGREGMASQPQNFFICHLSEERERERERESAEIGKVIELLLLR